ncbi:methylated-DNA--[protein]-cysteine S-methyltransferase [Caulobacter endophyticus]|uniref:methylated-DNA--[protein]-cysteine S-methyltransferase n=1 Tax=Caulobacter endophyticus TaxID=2172652 RepID=UPI00240FFF25|nr:methylated-DNA--[protein]-cysteine S-methyltransferase [Caulobacter endophyticus]MDG2527742.1 methylated-DNA--[protein]-cysteine S-methyltransferase [Caulobacter endophyticus]
MTTAYQTDDERWTAIERRDRAADSAFFCGVRTTGVYCRPSCAGRPLRKNVTFHDTREAARAAGLRPCLRCRPDEPIESLAYGFGQTPLGLALAATSQAGLALLILGDDRAAMAEDMAARFPRARLVEDDASAAPALAALTSAIESGVGATLALDERGSELQRAVWKALRDIPAGTTASYAQIARTIGRPQAVRAVAQACGANPLAVLTPCHRVVRSDGGLSGYRWGVERKRALLDRERAA